MKQELLSSGNRNKPIYQNDLFIAYFDPETVGYAKEICEDLGNQYPNLQVFCFEKFRDTGNFSGTPEIARDGTKSFLLIVDEKMLDPVTGKLKLLAPDEKTGKIGPRGAMKEILAAIENKFMQSHISNTANDPYKILLVRTPGSKAKLTSVSIIDEKEFIVEDEKTGNAKLYSNPFQNSNLLFYDPEKKEHIQTIGNWAQDISHLYVPEKETVGDIYWVGTRLSDISDCEAGVFVGSICLFGENDPTNNHYAYCNAQRRIDHNQMNVDADMWVFHTVEEVLRKNPNAHFYCYNPIVVFNTIDPETGDNPYNRDFNGEPIMHRFLCLNEDDVVLNMNSKEKFRKAFKQYDDTPDHVHFLRQVSLTKSEIKYNILMARLRGEYRDDTDPRFVIQAPISSGGASTFIMDSDFHNNKAITKSLDSKTTYICTVYQEHNIPVNLHAILFDGEDGSGMPRVLLSPPSIQLMRESEGRLIYRGADFIEARRIPQDLLDEFYRQARVVCNHLHKMGYRGVCGIDAILTDAKKKRDADFNPFDHVFLMEINTRFQASSGLLNRALKDQSVCDNHTVWPSLQMLNRMAFTQDYGALGEGIRRLFGKGENGTINGGNLFSNLVVPYANFSYLNNPTTEQAMRLLSFVNDGNVWKNNDIVAYELDGLSAKLNVPELIDSKYEVDAYLYRIVFKTNLVWINNESHLYFNENIIDENEDTYSFVVGNYGGERNRRERMIRVKVALLIQGVVFDEKVKQALGDRVREGTFNSVDIVFDDRGQPGKFDGYVVNAPIVNPHNYDEKGSGRGVKFTGLTPFEIKRDSKDGERLILTYYDNYIDNILLFPIDELASRNIKGVPYQDVAYLSTDRLRVHLTNACKYKVNNLGCKFCGITCGKKENLQEEDNRTFAQGNVQAVVSDYANSYNGQFVQSGDYVYFPKLRHYLVGGQTMDLDAEGAEPRLIETVRQISMATHGMSEIYAMIIPCSPTTVIRMKRAGLTHIAFNLELWDEDIAKDIMPGKRGENSRETYMGALDSARRTMGTHESVRSMLMVGLEPMENTLEAIDKLLEIDVQPMLSIFRPMPNTGEFANYMSPQITDVIDLFEKAEAKCNAKLYYDDNGIPDPTRKMHLGPDCAPCQNNTVALPYKDEHHND